MSHIWYNFAPQMGCTHQLFVRFCSLERLRSRNIDSEGIFTTVTNIDLFTRSLPRASQYFIGGVRRVQSLKNVGLFVEVSLRCTAPCRLQSVRVFVPAVSRTRREKTRCLTTDFIHSFIHSFYTFVSSVFRTKSRPSHCTNRMPWVDSRRRVTLSLSLMISGRPHF
jgi:hypothetical protein